jgi:nitronate monooxygenase
MPIPTVLTERLGLAHPIIQAPMAGGGDSPALVAAVSEAGGIGVFGAAYLAPSQIAEAAKSIRGMTRRPFGLNLFSPLPAPTPPKDFAPAIARLAPYYGELGVPPPTAPAPPAYSFDDQLATVLDSGAAMFSFTFAPVPTEAIAAAKARGMLVAGTATTVEEAVALERLGVDAVVVQGSEAGGHRGTFAQSFEASLIGTMALVPQVVDAVRVPVIASGGIMDGRGIAAAFALGAAAVQMGTAFLTCDEAGISDAYKEKILSSREHETRVTRAFSGRPARGIVNRVMTEVGDEVPGFPLQNALTRPMRTAAGKAGRTEYLSLWAGQGLRLARRQKAGELVARLAAETRAAVERIGG